MGWQKTFTLARRSKGCHLVTDEVLGQIDAGLRGVQVRVDIIFFYPSLWLLQLHIRRCDPPCASDPQTGTPLS